MSTITRERLLKIQQWRETYGPGSNVVLPAEEAEELARIALASLESEPVAWRYRTTDINGNPNARWSFSEEASLMGLYQPLYTAPPAPAPAPVVPDKMTYQDGVVFVLNNGMSSIERGTVARRAWNACRAAMLQGAEHVSNRDELLPGIKPAPELDSVAKNAESLPGNSPVIGWLRSDYNSDDKRDPNAPLFMLGGNDPSETWGVKYLPLSGNSPVIPDGYVVVPKRLTAENFAKAALSGEFSETKFINCPECFGDDECETCDGSGRIEIIVPVTWTTIKAIWSKGVEHFATAKLKEVG